MGRILFGFIVGVALLPIIGLAWLARGKAPVAVSDPPLPGLSVTLLEIERTIAPTVIGASRLMLLDDVGEFRKLAVTPAPLGTCAGVVQLLVVLQLPPPAWFHAEP